MDREQEEMQFLGMFGVYKESYKIIIARRRIFSQITLALILPLALVFLAHKEFSNLLLNNIIRSEIQLDATPAAAASRRSKIDGVLTSEWTYFWLLKAAYFTFLLVFSLLSTAAVVFTVASLYTSRQDLSFRKVITVVVPKVWKRLILTFLCYFLFIFAYNFVAFLLFVFAAVTLISFPVGGDYAFPALLFLYFAGFLYATIIWQLASVISVLEDSCGFPAMSKSRALIKGKTWLAIFIFFKLNFTFGAIQVMFDRFVVHPGSSLGPAGRTVAGVASLLLLLKVFLFGLVIQTVLYFVCKSYHHENIDKSALSEHLEGYLGDYVPLKSKDVQMESCLEEDEDDVDGRDRV